MLPERVKVLPVVPKDLRRVVVVPAALSSTTLSLMTMLFAAVDSKVKVLVLTPPVKLATPNVPVPLNVSVPPPV